MKSSKTSAASNGAFSRDTRDSGSLRRLRDSDSPTSGGRARLIPTQ